MLVNSNKPFAWLLYSANIWSNETIYLFLTIICCKSNFSLKKVLANTFMETVKIIMDKYHVNFMEYKV